MRGTPSIGTVWLLSCGLAAAQVAEEKNPFTSPSDVASGAKIFRSHCAVCHGLEGRGGRGPGLATGSFRHASSDAALLRVISDGIRGTEMPGIFFSPNQLWQVVAYIRSLAAAGSRESVSANTASGAALFRGKGVCGQCHLVAGEGGRLGPPLDQVGRLRSADFLRASLLEPNRDLHSGYFGVRAVDRKGATFTGIRLNEDTYSLQMLDAKEHLLSLDKKDLTELKIEKKSSMPSYKGALTPSEIEDLVAYLVSLGR